MCLRKLAGMAPLLLATSMAWALDKEAPVTVAALNSAAAVGGELARVPAPVTPRPVATTAATPSRVAPVASREPNAPRDLKALTALIGGLALVGWFQRRRAPGR